MTFNVTPKYSHSEAFDFNALGSKDKDYSYVQLPYHKESDTSQRILVVLDHMPSEDLKSGKLLSGVTKEMLVTLENLSKSFVKSKHKRFSWAACSFNMLRTYGKDSAFKESAETLFKDRVEGLILKYKPHSVIVFGDNAFRSMFPDIVNMSSGKVSPWYGHQIERTLSRKKSTHKFSVYANISLNIFVTRSEASALIGYAARKLAPALSGVGDAYKIDTKRISNHQSIFIDTIGKFDKLMDMLKAQPVLAIDTEGANLSKVTNKLFTVQFSKCIDYGYVIPMYHKDTPFTTKELKYIAEKLRLFFEGDNKNKFHIYVNAGFDLNMLRTQLRCRYMANKVYCILGGEYAIDENLKSLQGVVGNYYYSLSQLSVQYGATDYLTATFSKQHRTNIANAALDKDFLHYATLDTVIPFAICQKQQELASAIGHAKFLSLVTEQISDLIHGFSVMGTTGSKLDVEYLFSLRLPTSPIEAVIQDMENKLLNSKAALQAALMSARSKSIPTSTMFLGSSSSGGKGLAFASSTFTPKLNLRKTEDKHTLFFKSLKLEPLSVGKSGIGKLDKAFQKHYENVPEVAMYTKLEKAKKLKNAFVKSFIKLLGESSDVKFDHCVRPDYGYLGVVTGRTSAKNPNMQQIPSHSELGKHIKRLFIAPKGYLYVKVDYRVHEVRGWGLISFDKGIANIFVKAKKIRDLYRVKPSPELKKKLDLEADIHIMNASYFFGLPANEVKAKSIVEEIGSELIFLKDQKKRKDIMLAYADFFKDMALFSSKGIQQRDMSIVERFNGIKSQTKKLIGENAPKKFTEYQCIKEIRSIAGTDSVLKILEGRDFRNPVKGVTFGLIYQMSMKSLAENLKQSLEYTKNLVANFNKRFPNGMNWIEDTKKKARKQYFYENPLGFRRHLWGYLLPSSLDFARSMYGGMDRRAVNSPIQGMCAQFIAIGIRLLDTSIHKIRIQENREIGIKMCNSVHDSLEMLVPYESIIESIDLIEDSLTTKVREEVYRRHGFKFVVDLEVDFEVGSTLSNCQAWDMSLTELERIARESIEYQVSNLRYDVDTPKVLKNILVTQLKEKGSKWMKEQARNTNYKPKL